MTISGIRKLILERAETYWNGATVVWGATTQVVENPPLVVLRLGTVTRSNQPITQMINGIVFSAYPTEVPLQIDLFTRGNIVELPEDEEYSENTATNDLLDFVNFIDSTATIEWSNGQDVSISLLNGVQDLSDIINDTQWQYRAMVELRVSFMQWAAEYYGLLTEASIIFGEDGIPVDVVRPNWSQTASGGGTQKLADEKTGFFDKVDNIEHIERPEQEESKDG